MHITSLFTLPLVFAVLAAAQDATKMSTNTFAKSTCVTFKGAEAVKNVPTSQGKMTSTLDPATQTVTYRPITFTKRTKTIVIVKKAVETTTTTLSTSTDVITSTVLESTTTTQTDVETFTNVITVNETSTSTITTVAPTPSGFRPVGDTASIGNQPKRVMRMEAARLEDALSKRTSPRFEAFKYNKSVMCTRVVYVQVVNTVIVTRPITRPGLPKIVLSTTTSTKTCTSTVPLGSVTSTATTTSTVIMTALETNTVTTDITSTNTIVATATVYSSYAACAPETNNIINKYNDQAITNGSVLGRLVTKYDITSAEACCEACQKAEGCGASYFLSPSTCHLLYQAANQCLPSQAVSYLMTGSGAGLFTVSNGACGFVGHNGP